MQSLKKKTEGFTIIEVMIVLVIAAVIILIVFLAVPALQRNSRNNQRKNDVSRISAAVTEEANNSSGDLASTYGDIDPYIGDLGFYDLPSPLTTSIPTGAFTNNLNPETVMVRTSASCALDGNGNQNGNAAASTSDREFVVLYAVETGGSSDSKQCVEG